MMYVSWTLANFGGGQTIPAYCCNQVAGASKTGSSWPRLTLGARPTTSRSRSRLLPPGVQLYSSQHDLGSSTSNSRLRRWKRSTRCRTVCGSTNDIDGEPAAGVRRVRHVATSLFSGATSPTSGNTNAGDHSVEEDANKKSTNATGSVDRTRLPPRRDVEDAHRVFALGKRLHLRRHRSRVARDTALRLFRESMRLRPDWRETDARFAVDSGIDSVFKTFSCSSGDRNTKSQRSTVGSNTSNSTADTKGHDGVRCYDGSKPSRRSGNCGEQAWGDIAVRNAVVCLRATLAGIGYTAWRVQERFGRAAGPAHGQRLPGPYYLRKSLDHTHVRGNYYTVGNLRVKSSIVAIFSRAAFSHSSASLRACHIMQSLLYIVLYITAIAILMASRSTPASVPASAPASPAFSHRPPWWHP